MRSPLARSLLLLLLACPSLAETVPGYVVTVYSHPGAASTGFRDINVHGDVVGYYQTDAGDPATAHALRIVGGTAETIDPPTSTGDRRAFGNDDAGNVAGSFFATGEHGFELSGSTYTQIDYPGTTQNTTPRGLNDAGDLSGEYVDGGGVQHGFVRIGGAYQTVDAPGATSTTVRAINDHGRMAGFYEDATSALHGFVSDDGVAFTIIDHPGAVSTLVGGIDNAGRLVGVYLSSPGSPATTPARGFLYESGSFTAFDLSDAQSTLPIGLNELGEIVGEFVDAGGTRRAFIATPMPEPRFAWLAGGLLLTWLRSWRARRRLD